MASDSLAERIAIARKHRGISQSELERRAKLSKGYLSRLGRPSAKGGREQPTLPTLLALAEQLQVHMGWLIGSQSYPRFLDDPPLQTEELTSLASRLERLEAQLARPKDTPFPSSSVRSSERGAPRK